MSSEQSTQIIGTAYFTTLQGICKVVQVVASLIGALLVGIDFYGYAINIFESAAAISIIVAAILLILYSTGSIKNLGSSSNRGQFFFHVILSIYYIVAVALVLHYGGGFGRLIAGGIFGLIAIIAHLVDGYDNFKKQPLC